MGHLIKNRGYSNRRLLSQRLSKYLEAWGGAVDGLLWRSGHGLPHQKRRSSASAEKIVMKPGCRKVNVLRPNRRGTKLAVVVTNQEEAQKLRQVDMFYVLPYQEKDNNHQMSSLSEI